MSNKTGDVGAEASDRKLTVFEVSGDQVAMGRQHGQMTREVGGYEAAMAFYSRLPLHVLGGGRRDLGRNLAVRLIERALAPGILRLDRARPVVLRERTQAFMDALGRPERERLALVGLDATQNAIGLLSRLGLTRDANAGLAGSTGLTSLAFPGACSSFAVWGESSEDGRLLHGRNFDLPGIGVWDRAPAVVFCQPRRHGLSGRSGGLRYGFVTTRGADVPGVTAFNEAGLTVTAHTRFHRAVSFSGLGIVDLGHLIVSQAKTIAEAVAIAGSHRIASSWALVVSSADERRAAAIEVHAGRVALDLGPPGQTWFAATNRFQVPAMQPGEVAPSAAWVRYSDGRLAVMRRSLEERRGLGPQDAMRLLASHEAGDVPGWSRATGDCLGQIIGIQSVVVDPERAAIWVSTGDTPASRGPWVAVPWRWSGTPSLFELSPTIGRSVPRSAGPSGGDDYRSGLSGEAYRAFARAALLESRRAPEAAVLATLEDAIRVLPGDPSFRHLAGGVALRMGDFDGAASHFDAALATERSVFRVGELLHWASRAADWAGRGRLARGYRKALVAMSIPETGPARRALEKPMPRRAHREIGVDFQILTLSL